MGKNKFVAEFEVNASAKILFPYLSTASGLSQWFAEDVNVNKDEVYSFHWDREDHEARKVSQRANQYVKFEFLPESEEDEEDPAYIELKLDVNEITRTVFIRITDYSDFSDLDDPEEQYNLWKNVVRNLKELTGG